MTPATIIGEALADGVRLALTATGGAIKATGGGAAVNRWLPVIREHKAEIIGALRFHDQYSRAREAAPLTTGEQAAIPQSEGAAGLYRAGYSIDSGTPEFSEHYARAREAAPLTAGEERAILAWLAHIGETDPATVAEVMDKCQRDARARAYVIDLAGELSAPAPPGPVRCGDCVSYERSAHHPNLGGCAKRQPEAVAGLCDTDPRWCSRFKWWGNGLSD